MVLALKPVLETVRAFLFSELDIWLNAAKPSRDLVVSRRLLVGMANNWTEFEVEAVVRDYFQMLLSEMAGRRFNKTAHRRELKQLLNNRSDASIEFKHQNITAVMMLRQYPYIAGYKPASNYQKALAPAVDSYLTDHPELFALFEADSRVVPEIPSVANLLSRLENAPKREERRHLVREPGAIYIPAQPNYLAMEASNSLLGERGEEFVINYEKARLIHAGEVQLADQIEQVSLTVGPTAGFDIHSYEVDGKDRFIEAKTTKYGKTTPFYVTPNELRFSREHAERYHLYRVFGFRLEPKLFEVSGNLEERCRLIPSQYLASL